MRSLPPDLDSTQNFLKNRFKFKYCLGPDEVLEKYHEAVVHYSKYEWFFRICTSLGFPPSQMYTFLITFSKDTVMPESLKQKHLLKPFTF